MLLDYRTVALCVLFQRLAEIIATKFSRSIKVLGKFFFSNDDSSSKAKMDWPHLSFSHNADVQVIIIFLFGKGKVKSWDRSSGTPITSAFLGTSHGFAIYEPGWKERRLDDRNTLIMVVRSSEKRRPFHNGITVLPLLPQLLFSAMHSEKDETFLAHFLPLWHCF